MAEISPKITSAVQLRWDYGVYQNLARLVFVASIIVGGLVMLYYPDYIIEFGFMMAFFVGMIGVLMVALVRAMSRLKAGDEFSIFWIRYFIGSKRWRRSAPSPVSIHRYSLGHIFSMITFVSLMVSFIPWDPGVRIWIEAAWYIPLIIGAGFTWAGYAASFQTPTEQPQLKE